MVCLREPAGIDPLADAIIVDDIEDLPEGTSVQETLGDDSESEWEPDEIERDLAVEDASDASGNPESEFLPEVFTNELQNLEKTTLLCCGWTHFNLDDPLPLAHDEEARVELLGDNTPGALIVDISVN